VKKEYMNTKPDTNELVRLRADIRKKKRMPNKKTLKSIENIEKGKNLTEINDLQDLFKKLGI